LQPVKSELEYPVKVNEILPGYHKPTCFVPWRYFRILLAALKCDSFGADWKRAHMHTTNIMSGLLAVRYYRDPISPLYLVSSTGFPAIS